MHALLAQGLLDIVADVTAIWGEDPQSTQGLDQFRLSVTLSDEAIARLRANGYPAGGRNAHVKLADGGSVSRSDAATARQPGDGASMQVSWKVSRPTVGEIDIDYIPYGGWEFWRAVNLLTILGFGHGSPQNSDVRADLPGIPSNYDEHVERLRIPGKVVDSMSRKVLLAVAMAGLLLANGSAAQSDRALDSMSGFLVSWLMDGNSDMTMAHFSASDRALCLAPRYVLEFGAYNADVVGHARRMARADLRSPCGAPSAGEHHLDLPPGVKFGYWQLLGALWPDAGRVDKRSTSS